MKRFAPSPSAYALLVLLLTPGAYFLAYQANPSLHFGIGRWDRTWLDGGTSFYPPARMEGPLRDANGTVRVEQFAARLTGRLAGLHLPYHALRSPIRVRIRCHRFGLGGKVTLVVNGTPIEEFSFTRGSYPWGGIQAVIPQQVAEKAPLHIRLVTTGGEVPPSHLPGDLGVGLDWIELEPMSAGALLLPTTAEWARLFLALVAVLLLLRFIGAPRALEPMLLFIFSASIVTGRALYPLLTARALEVAWLALLGLMALLWTAELADRAIKPPARARGESG